MSPLEATGIQFHHLELCGGLVGVWLQLHSGWQKTLYGSEYLIGATFTLFLSL